MGFVKSRIGLTVLQWALGVVVLIEALLFVMPSAAHEFTRTHMPGFVRLILGWGGIAGCILLIVLRVMRAPLLPPRGERLAAFALGLCIYAVESSFFYVRQFRSLGGGPDEYVFVTCRLTGGTPPAAYGLAAGAPAAWLPFVRRVAEDLGHLVGFWCTINEPTIYAHMGWLEGEFPPGRRGDANQPVDFVGHRQVGGLPGRTRPGSRAR